MAKINIIASVNAKPINKWLLLGMVLTIAATVWTATHENSANDNASVQLARRVVSTRQLDSTHVEHSGLVLSSASNNLAFNTKEQLIPWEKLKRSPLQSKTNDVFKVHSWLVVPPVKKVKPPPPPPPTAPTAPFFYIGKLEDTPKGTLIFLIENNKLYSVIKGEKINQQWRLDNEDLNSIHLTYLPLGLPQLLSKSTKEVMARNPNPVEMNP